MTNDLGLRLPGLAIALLVFAVLISQETGGARRTMLTNVWRGLNPGVASVREIKASIGAPDREADGVKYGSVIGLHLMTYDDLTASLFLRDDRLRIVVLSPKADGEYPMRIDEWEKMLGKPARKLPSVQGKNHRLLVYSESGLTATADGSIVTLVEVFPPMSPDEYERTFYKIPSPFIK